MAPTVTLLPGDGIGPEVIDVAVRVVEAAGAVVEWEVHHVGQAVLDGGSTTPLPEAVLESIRRNRMALKGPVSTPAGRVGFRSVNVDLRRRLGLFAQVRRCRSWPGVASPFPQVDLLVIRETTEDLYAGVEVQAGTEAAVAVNAALAATGQELPRDAGMSIKWTTPAAARRAVEFAFGFARDHGRRKVTVVHKASVMRQTDGIFLEAAAEVAAANTDIAYDDCLVDNLCARLVRTPESYDVLVMPNMYGDIVSDLAAGLTGGVGLVPGVNVGADTFLFEAGHGSAPAYAGRGIVNPTAMILSAALLVEALGQPAVAAAVERAVAEVLADGAVRTYDLVPSAGGGGAASTSAMGDAVIARLP